MYAPSLGSFPPRLNAKIHRLTNLKHAIAPHIWKQNLIPNLTKPNLAFSRCGSERVKFANLTSNFTHRDPYLENVKFAFSARRRQINLHAVQQPLTCSVDGGGFCVAALAAASRRGRVCLRQLRVCSTMQRKRALYFALLVAASRP